MDYLTEKIFGARNRIENELESIKTTIQCDGDVCIPMKVIPPSHHDAYVERLRQTFGGEALENVRVQKQRQFISLVNRLYNSRSDYLLHRSNYTTKTWSFLYIEGDTVFVDLSTVPDDTKDVQAFYFFKMRDLCAEKESIKIVVSVEGMSLFDLVRFYKNKSGDTHLIGYLMHESCECEVDEILVKTSSSMQRIAANLIKSVFSKRTQDKFRIE